MGDWQPGNWRKRFARWRRRGGATVTAVAARTGDDAQNSGLLTVNGPAAELAGKTVIVLGVARGGTSMVAGALAHLGVHMGQTRSAVYEDSALTECFQRGDHAAARTVVAARNAAHPVWGFKKPRLDLLDARWQGLFRAPVYVVVLRDPLAVAGRRAITAADELFDHFDTVLREQQRLLDFVRGTTRPCLLVSYEKALLDAGFFAQELARFTGVGDAEAIAAAAAFVTPSPEAYRRGARIDTPRAGADGSWRGNLERVGPDAVAGWAFRGEGDTPVTVGLYVNGVLRAQTSAEAARQDVRTRYRLAADGCGFEFRNGEQAVWEGGDFLAVRLLGESEDLNNSPQVCRV